MNSQLEGAAVSVCGRFHESLCIEGALKANVVEAPLIIFAFEHQHGTRRQPYRGALSKGFYIKLDAIFCFIRKKVELAKERRAPLIGEYPEERSQIASDERPPKREDKAFGIAERDTSEDRAVQAICTAFVDKADLIPIVDEARLDDGLPNIESFRELKEFVSMELEELAHILFALSRARGACLEGVEGSGVASLDGSPKLSQRTFERWRCG